VTFVVAVGATTVALLFRARRLHGVGSLQLGSLIVWAVLAIPATLLAAPAGYLVGIPLLLMSAGALLRALVKNGVVLAFVVVVFMFPVGALLCHGLNLSSGFVVSFMAALTLCAILPTLDMIGRVAG
jgi:hypothetical protein